MGQQLAFLINRHACTGNHLVWSGGTERVLAAVESEANSCCVIQSTATAFRCLPSDRERRISAPAQVGLALLSTT